MESKANIRRNLSNQRAAISAKQRNLTSQVIVQRLLNEIDWNEIKNAHIYQPLSKLNEVNTLPFFQHLWQNYPGVLTATWKSVAKNKYQTVAVVSLADLKKLNILTPLPTNIQYDVIVVPMLGFDNKGQRLGLGGGFYDRFLATQKTSLSVGLCYDFGYLRQGLASEKHDIPLKLVVTEKKVYKF